MTHRATFHRAGRLAALDRRLEGDCGHDPQAQLVSVIMRESLHAVLAPHVSDEVLLGALATDPDAGFPSAPSELTPFVQGPLRAQLANRVGDDVADGVIADLMRLLRDLARAPVGRHVSGSRLAPRRERAGRTQREDAHVTISRDSTLPAPIGGVRLVRLVTPDRLTRMQLTERLDGVGCVAAADDDDTAVGSAPPGSPNPILVLDCRLPCSELTRAASRALATNDDTTVVLWGTNEDVNATLVDLPVVPEGWIRCGEMTPQDVAMLCMMLGP